MPTWLLPSVLDPARLLLRNASRWLPIVAALAMVGKLPEVFIQLALPGAMSTLGGLQNLDLELLQAAAGAVLVLFGLKLIFELVAFMLAFIILADITAGRPSDLWAGLGRLASWKLQFAWLFAGFVEQVAISAWFVGGALLLVPFGFATTSAYEEANGFSSFSRSLRLGQGGRPIGHGFRVAAAVTIGFFVSFVVTTFITIASCALSAGQAAPGLLALLTGGDLDLSTFSVPDYGTVDIIVDLFFAPFAMIPTVYMMAVQQMGYWAARRELAIPQVRSAE